MAVYQLDDVMPVVAESAWVAGSAEVMGRVELAEEASVWFGAVLRGDNELLRIGRGSNVQDGSVVHSDIGSPVDVGEWVTIGHRAVLHGCRIGDGTLVGIGAVVLNGAVVGRDCLIGAGALVTEGKVFPDASLIIGSPARAVRTLSAEQIATVRSNCLHYVENARRFRSGLHLLAR